MRRPLRIASLLLVVLALSSCGTSENAIQERTQHPLKNAPPSILFLYPAPYSDEMFDADLKGDVIVALKIDEKGNAFDVRIVSSDNPAFDKYVPLRIKECRFVPKITEGNPVVSEEFLIQLHNERSQAIMLTPSEPVVPPEEIKRVDPKYPSSMRRHHMNAVGEARLVVNSTGDVTYVDIPNSSRLDAAKNVFVALKQWKFKPATYKGVPISSAIKVPFVYYIQFVFSQPLTPPEVRSGPSC
jgi:outer membrane biosynthesis protein TonB